MPAVMKSARAQASYQGRVQDLAEDHPFGKSAASTTLLNPPNTNQNVPINSAVTRFLSGISFPP